MADEKNSNFITWRFFIITAIAIIGIGSTMIVFGFYPKSDGMVLETKVENNTAEIAENDREINEIQQDVKQELKDVNSKLSDIKLEISKLHK